MLSKFYLILILFFVANTAFAEVCFKNEKDYKDNKDSLPIILQEMPVYFSHKSLLAMAIGSVRIINGSVRFIFSVMAILNNVSVDEAGVIVCAHGDKVKFKFPNDNVEVVTIVDTAINVRGKLDMEKTSKKNYQKIEASLVQLTGNSPKKAPSGEVVNQ